MENLLQFHPEVRLALSEGQAVVALESTVIAHGLPYPANLETARSMEAIVRGQGAVPATIAVLDGRLCVGLDSAELEHLATAKRIRKASRRDLAVTVARGGDAALGRCQNGALAALGVNMAARVIRRRSCRRSRA